MTAVDPSSVNVPRSAIEALREAVAGDWGNANWLSRDANDLIVAARALVDSVTEAEHES